MHITDVPDCVLLSLWPSDRVLDGLAVGSRALSRSLRGARRLVSVFRYDSMPERGVARSRRPESFLRMFRSLEELTLQWEKMSLHQQGQVDFRGALEGCERLRSLSVCMEFMGECTQGLLLGLPAGLQSLTVQCRVVDEGGAEEILRGLPGGLTSLSMVRCNAVMLSESRLEGWPGLPSRLKSLDLSRSVISEGLCRALLSSLPDGLESLDMGHMVVNRSVRWNSFMRMPRSLRRLSIRGMCLPSGCKIVDLVRVLPRGLASLDVSRTNNHMYHNSSSILSSMPQSVQELDIGPMWYGDLDESRDIEAEMGGFPRLRSLNIHFLHLMAPHNQEWSLSLRNLLHSPAFSGLRRVAIKKTGYGWMPRQQSSLWARIIQCMPSSVEVLDLSFSLVQDAAVESMIPALRGSGVKVLVLHLPCLSKQSLASLESAGVQLREG